MLSTQLYEMSVIAGLKSEKDMREQNKGIKNINHLILNLVLNNR